MDQSQSLTPDLAGSKIDKHGRDSKKPKSRATSCERCKRRKQKCDHRLPTCTNCLKAGAECVQPEKYVQHVPEKDDYTLLLEKKVAKLEDKLRNGGYSPAAHSPQTATGSNLVSRASPSISASATPSASHNFVLPHHSYRVSVDGRITSQHSTPNTTPTPPAIPIPQSSRVSILNIDPSSGTTAPPPQSFSVVSSLLQDTYWGRADAKRVLPTNLQESKGLMPDYDLEEYLKCRPVEVPNDAEGEVLLQRYHKIHGKFTFIDRNLFLKLHHDRHIQPRNLDDPTYRFNGFMLFAVYAMATVLSPLSESRAQAVTNSERLYATALCHARLCKTQDPIMQIKALVMCALFQMRTDKDNGCHFDMVNRAMKLCYEIGLHEGRGLDSLPLHEQEMRKRLFWSAYGLERLYAVSTGRPFVIDEKDVTLSFPVDVDDDELTDEKITAAREAERQNGQPLHNATPLSFVIYLWKLRRLECDMVIKIYQKDKSMEEQLAKVDYYLGALRRWRDEYPDLTPREHNIAAIAYSKAVRLLLQPFLASLDPNGPLFKKCVLETGRICSVFRDFYRKTESGFTTIAMHTNFIAGLTLIYCLWLSKDGDYLPILESIRACTASLYVLTERSHLCRNYRETFENLVTQIIQTVTNRTRGVTDMPTEPEESETPTVASQVIPQRPPLVAADSTTSVFENMNESAAQQVKQENGQFEDMKPSVGILDQHHLVQPQPQANIPVQEGVMVPPPPASQVPVLSGPSPPNAAIATSAPPEPSAASSAAPNIWAGVMPSGVPAINNTQQQQQEQQTQQQRPPPQSNRGWIDAYGYDDSMYNMIQDISSWTRTNPVVADGINNNNSQQIADHMWTNFTDFSLT